MKMRWRMEDKRGALCKLLPHFPFSEKPLGVWQRCFDDWHRVKSQGNKSHKMVSTWRLCSPWIQVISFIWKAQGQHGSFFPFFPNNWSWRGSRGWGYVRLNTAQIFLKLFLSVRGRCVNILPITNSKSQRKVEYMLNICVLLWCKCLNQALNGGSLTKQRKYFSLQSLGNVHILKDRI